MHHACINLPGATKKIMKMASKGENKKLENCILLGIGKLIRTKQRKRNPIYKALNEYE
jgi:hypothetical protein